MCNFIGWNTCNTDSTNWGNYSDVASASYTGYHSTDGHSDWVNETGVTKGTSNNRWIFPTGKFVNSSNRTTAKKNIYDVAGNVWEWTTEVPCYSTSNSVFRGGGADGGGGFDYVTTRHGDGSAKKYTNWVVGFRMVLYVE